MQRAHFKTHRQRGLAVRAARGDAQAHFVWFGAALTRDTHAMQARHADVVNANLGVGKAACAQAFAHDFLGEFRARQRIGSGVADFAFADVAVVITDHHFVGRRARPRFRARHAHAVFALLSEFHVGDVEYAVGRDVARGVVHLVENLLGAGHHVEPAAGVFELAQREVPVRADVGVREADVDGIVAIFFAGVDEATAGNLCCALHQMARQCAGCELGVIIVAPTESVEHGAEEQRRIRNAPGHYHGRAGGEAIADDIGAQIDIGRCHVR